MKNIVLLFCLIFSSTFITAQYGPPRPNIDAAYKKVKETGGIYKSLENKYGMSNPKSTCKLEKKYYTTNAYGKIYENSKYSDPEWRFRKSKLTKKQESLLNTNLDYDICYITFTFKTSKNNEGISYEIPVSVWYVRRQNTVLTNEWHFDGATLDPPYKVYGKSHKEEFYTMVQEMIQGVKAVENQINIRPSGISGKLRGMYRFKSITEGPEMDETKKSSNVESITRWYYVTGDFIIYENNQYDSILEHFTNRTIGLKIKFSKKLEYNNQKEGSWTLDSFEYGSGWPVEGMEGEKSQDLSLRGTYERFGFEYVNKDQPIIPIPYFSKKSKQLWGREVDNILRRLSNGDLTAMTDLKKYTSSDEVANGFKEIFYDQFYKKMCYIKESDKNIVEQYQDKQRSEVISILNLSYKRDYCSGDDKKECLKKFKEGGMSKEGLKGSFRTQQINNSLNAELKMILIDNQYYFDEAPVLNEEISF